VISSPVFAGKRYAVLGLARSGLATVAALLASGAHVTAWDNDEAKRQGILPGTGRGTAVEGGSLQAMRLWRPPSTSLRLVPLPVPGRI